MTTLDFNGDITVLIEKLTQLTEAEAKIVIVDDPGWNIDKLAAAFNDQKHTTGWIATPGPEGHGGDSQEEVHVKVTRGERHKSSVHPLRWMWKTNS